MKGEQKKSGDMALFAAGCVKEEWSLYELLSWVFEGLSLRRSTAITVCRHVVVVPWMDIVDPINGLVLERFPISEVGGGGKGGGVWAVDGVENVIRRGSSAACAVEEKGEEGDQREQGGDEYLHRSSFSLRGSTFSQGSLGSASSIGSYGSPSRLVRRQKVLEQCGVIRRLSQELRRRSSGTIVCQDQPDEKESRRAQGGRGSSVSARDMWALLPSNEDVPAHSLCLKREMPAVLLCNVSRHGGMDGEESRWGFMKGRLVVVEEVLGVSEGDQGMKDGEGSRTCHEYARVRLLGCPEEENCEQDIGKEKETLHNLWTELGVASPKQRRSSKDIGDEMEQKESSDSLLSTNNSGHTRRRSYLERQQRILLPRKHFLLDPLVALQRAHSSDKHDLTESSSSIEEKDTLRSFSLAKTSESLPNISYGNPKTLLSPKVSPLDEGNSAWNDKGKSSPPLCGLRRGSSDNGFLCYHANGGNSCHCYGLLKHHRVGPPRVHSLVERFQLPLRAPFVVTMNNGMEDRVKELEGLIYPPHQAQSTSQRTAYADLEDKGTVDRGPILLKVGFYFGDVADPEQFDLFLCQAHDLVNKLGVPLENIRVAKSPSISTT
eukprot:Nk52_evm145s226 gene=Nk52_evmTU145s226